MPYLQENAPRKDIYLCPQVGDINLGKDLNLSENLYMYVGDVENKGTTRNNVDPKVLRHGRNLRMLILQ
jgi:hypothetical protein